MSQLAEAPPRAAGTRDKPRDAKSVFPMHRVKLEEPSSDGRRRIEGYAAVFGNRDSYGDIIMPGAFADSLTENPDVKVLWQHDTHQPIGKQESAYEDDFGLAVVGAMTNIPLVTSTVVPLLLDEVVTGLSIGYSVLEEDYDSDLEAWLLKVIRLYEWSPVTFPANELAGVSEVKKLGEADEAANVARVERHAKTLSHLLGGYFAKSDRQGALPSDLLAKLATQIGGSLPGGEGSEAVKAAELEAAEMRGGIAALDALKSTQES